MALACARIELVVRKEFLVGHHDNGRVFVLWGVSNLLSNTVLHLLKGFHTYIIKIQVDETTKMEGGLSSVLVQTKDIHNSGTAKTQANWRTSCRNRRKSLNMMWR